jgi:hypothetical protein
MKTDKIYHLIAGFTFSLLLIVVIDAERITKLLTIVLGLLLISIGKEGFDYIVNKITKTQMRHVEFADFAYTMIGGLIPLIIFNIFF